MKKIILILAFLISALSFSQAQIGDGFGYRPASEATKLKLTTYDSSIRWEVFSIENNRKERWNGVDTWEDAASTGNMEKSVYDPNDVEGDAFDMENMVEGATKKILTQVERDSILSFAEKLKHYSFADYGPFEYSILIGSNTYPGSGIHFDNVNGFLRLYGIVTVDQGIDMQGNGLFDVMDAITDDMAVNKGQLDDAIAGSVDNTAYNPATWTSTTISPSKNAIKDKFVSVDAAIAAANASLAGYFNLSGNNTISGNNTFSGDNKFINGITLGGTSNVTLNAEAAIPSTQTIATFRAEGGFVASESWVLAQGYAGSALALSSTIATSRDALLTDANGVNNVNTASTSKVTITIDPQTDVAWEDGTVLVYQVDAADAEEGTYIDIAYGVGVTGEVGRTYSYSRTIKVWRVAEDEWVLIEPPVVDRESFIISTSDLTTDITTGDMKGIVYVPFDFFIESTVVYLKTAGTSTGITVDITKNGASIYDTLMTTDVGDNTNIGATTPYVFDVAGQDVTAGDVIEANFDAVPTEAVVSQVIINGYRL